MTTDPTEGAWCEVGRFNFSVFQESVDEVLGDDPPPPDARNEESATTSQMDFRAPERVKQTPERVKQTAPEAVPGAQRQGGRSGPSNEMNLRVR